MNVYANYQDSVILLAENLTLEEAKDFMSNDYITDDLDVIFVEDMFISDEIPFYEPITYDMVKLIEEYGPDELPY